MEDNYQHKSIQAEMDLVHKDQAETKQSSHSSSNVCLSKYLMFIQSSKHYPEQDLFHRYSNQMILFQHSMCTANWASCLTVVKNSWILSIFDRLKVTN